MPRLPGQIAFASIVFVLAGAARLAPEPARAAEAASAQTSDLSYDVYVGGLHVFSFDVEMTLQPDRYRLTAEGETQGMVSWFSTWHVKLTAEGSDRSGRIAPNRYVTESAWQGKQRMLALGFVAGGRYDLQQTPPPEPDPDIEGELPERLPQGTIDPLTFAIAASRALQQTGRCDQTVPIFDGQRRYDLIVKQVGETTLPPNSYSIYQGPATRCSFAVNRISGFRKSMRPSPAAEAAPPTLWMAAIRADLPPVPVRYEGAIKLGKIVIHLTDARFRTEPATAE
jgi:hypothetical protein